MSKKMLKRSLALGALMAFVITGQAWAATLSGEITGSGNKTYTDDSASATVIDTATIKGYDNLTIESTFGNAIGKPAPNNSTITIEANNIILKANNSYSDNGTTPNGNAIQAYGDNHNALKAIVNVTATGDLTLLANNRIIRATGKLDPAGPTIFNESEVTITANNIYMNSNADGTVTNGLVDDAAIKVDKTAKVTITAENNLFLNATGEKNPRAIYVGGHQQYDGATVELWPTPSVVMKANNAVINGGIKVQENAEFSFEGNQFKVTGEDICKSDNSYLVHAHAGGAKINIDSDVINITNYGKVETKHAVYSASGANINFKDFNELNIHNYDETGIDGEGGCAVIASNGAINITGKEGSIVNIYADNRAAVASLGSEINITNIGDLKLTSTFDSSNSSSYKKAVLSAAKYDDTIGGKNVQITTDKLTITNVSDIAETYAIYVTDNGSVMNINAGTANIVGGIQTVNNGVLNLNLGEDFTWDASNTGENTVTELKGTGTIIVASDDDKVTVGSGDATLSVQADGVLAEAIASESDQASALQALADKVEGVEVTQVGTAEGEVAGAITAQVGEGGKVVAGSIKEAVNTVNQAIGEAAVNFKAHYRAHMNDMNKRMGELRMANGETGVWTRMVRGENEFEGAKSQYNQYQLGYDEKLSVDKRWTVGAAVTFAEGTGSFSQGSTEDDSTAFAIYGSKLNNDGTFVDLIARYARLESDITMGKEKADYSTNGYSVSAEFGKRIQQGKGFWIEPQVELTYGSVDSAEYIINGKDVTVGDMDSLIGRVGFSLGKDIKQGNVYARASYLYDFDGETDTTFGKNGVTRTIEEDLGGGWWEVGVGANINLSKATYIYADIEKTFGGKIDTNWQWNLGVRYSF